MLLRSLSRRLRRGNGFFAARGFVLGIESSCDDSGAAVLSEDGRLLGESLITQRSARYGGVIPSFAMGFHADALPKVVREAVSARQPSVSTSLSGLRDRGIKLIAVTNRPGLSGSLSVGCNFAKYLCLKNDLPMMAVHHMEAHALTARMTRGDLRFPFMLLLISGGHCFLAMAEDVKKFYVFGCSTDNAPGEVLDKAARRLKLHLLRSDLRDVSGGKAIEIVGRDGDPTSFPLHVSMRQHRDCRFSFSGLYTQILDGVDSMEKEVKLDHDAFLPDLPHFCASIEYSAAKHLCERLQRGLEYADLKNLWKSNKGNQSLVVSGGVASNKRIRSSLEKVCHAFDCQLVSPEPKYCTDNGVMIAWNALERYRQDPTDVVSPARVFGINVLPRSEFGVDVSKDVTAANIKCEFVDIL